MKFAQKIKAFAKDQSGVAVVEFILLVPVLAFAMMMSFVFFDAYKTKNTSQKASYTIADLLSRQTDAVDEDYLEGLKDLFDFIANTDPQTTSIRVSSILYKKNKDLNKVKWSYVVGDNVTPWKTSKLKDLYDYIPDVSNKDYLIIVETFVSYSPPFAGVIEIQEFTTFTPVSPRFAPHLAWGGA